MKTSTLGALCAALFTVCTLPVAAQTVIKPNQTAADLAAAIDGPFVVISSPVLTCKDSANAVFSTTVSSLGIADGILLTTGRAVSAPGGPGGYTTWGLNGPADSMASYSNAMPGDTGISALMGGALSFDACALEFDVVPSYDTLLFDYVFGSEEYTYYSCSPFNDAFAFYISGPGIIGVKNIALIPGTSIPVAINSTTDTAITAPFSAAACAAMGTGSPFGGLYYNSNRGDSSFTYDGFTVPLKAKQHVTVDSVYHLRLVVADVADGVLDAGVFIKASSVTSKPALGPTAIRNAALEGLTAAPNPFADVPSLRVPAVLLSEALDVRITDGLGRTVGQYAGPGSGLNAALGEALRPLSGGLYSVRITAPALGATTVLKLQKR